MLPFFYMCYPEVDTLSKLQLEQFLYLTMKNNTFKHDSLRKRRRSNSKSLF